VPTDHQLARVAPSDRRGGADQMAEARLSAEAKNQDQAEHPPRGRPSIQVVKCDQIRAKDHRMSTFVEKWEWLLHQRSLFALVSRKSATVCLSGDQKVE